MLIKPSFSWRPFSVDFVGFHVVGPLRICWKKPLNGLQPQIFFSHIFVKFLLIRATMDTRSFTTL